MPAEATLEKAPSISTKKYGVDVLMIYPRTGQDVASTVAPPHGLLAVAAPLLKAGYRVKVIDQRVNPNWKEEILQALNTNPICVTIASMVGFQLRYALSLAEMVRKHTNGKIPIVWGGPLPTIVPNQMLEHPMVDIICVREADITFLEVVNALQANKSLKDISGVGYKDGGKLILNPERELLNVEDLLPVPWGLVNVEDYIHPDMYLKVDRTLDVGETSRGCPFKCGFCSSASLRLRRWRAKSVDKTLDEITTMVRKYNLNGIWMRDDEFYVNRTRARGITEGFIKNNLNIRWYTSGTRVDNFLATPDEQVAIYKQSGAHSVKFGAESGSQRILDLIQKEISPDETMEANMKCKKHGIVPVYSLQIGFPTETWPEMNQTIDLWYKLKAANPEAQFEGVCIYTAFPGTPMWKMALEHGLQEPKHLEDWIDFVYDSEDPEGKRSPWFNALDRKRMSNIAHMYILANSLSNVLDALENKFLKHTAKFAYYWIEKFYQWRLRHKYYTFSVDIDMVRFLKRKIFEEGFFTIK